MQATTTTPPPSDEGIRARKDYSGISGLPAGPGGSIPVSEDGRPKIPASPVGSPLSTLMSGLTSVGSVNYDEVKRCEQLGGINVLMGYWANSESKIGDLFHRDFKSVDNIVRFLEVLSEEVTSALQKKPRMLQMGIYSEAATKECSQMSVGSLSAALFVGNHTPTMTLTQANIVGEMMKYAGATMVKEMYGGESIMVLKMSGINTVIPMVSEKYAWNTGDALPTFNHRIWLEELLVVYGVRAEYLRLDEVVIHAARILALVARLEKTKGGASLLQTRAPKVLATFGYTPSSALDFSAAGKILVEALSNKAYKPYGEKSKMKSAPHKWGVYLQRHLEVYPTILPVLQDLVRRSLANTDMLDAKYEAYRSADAMHAYRVTTGQVQQSVVKIPSFSPFSVANYVQSSRDVFRGAQRSGDTIMGKKMDSYGYGAIAGAATSVAQKFGRALKLFNHHHKGGKYEVSAFGVSRENWWQETIVANDRVEKVVWYDVDDSNVPAHMAGKVVRADIRYHDNAGGVPVIFSDVLLESQSNRDLEVSKGKFYVGDHLAITSRVVENKYAGGILKMYLTSADPEAGNVLAPSLIKLLEHYEVVELVPGGGPHSPEYFVVFTGFSEEKISSDKYHAAFMSVLIMYHCHKYDIVWTNSYYNDQMHYGVVAPSRGGAFDSECAVGDVVPVLRGYTANLAKSCFEREKEGTHVVTSVAEDLSKYVKKAKI